MTTDFQYDVFLSHNQADKTRVRRLAERLRADNMRVWFDEWIIQPGSPFKLRALASALTQGVLFRNPSNSVRGFIPMRRSHATIKCFLAECSPDFHFEEKAAQEFGQSGYLASGKEVADEPNTR